MLYITVCAKTLFMDIHKSKLSYITLNILPISGPQYCKTHFECYLLCMNTHQTLVHAVSQAYN